MRKETAFSSTDLKLPPGLLTGEPQASSQRQRQQQQRGRDAWPARLSQPSPTGVITHWLFNREEKRSPDPVGGFRGASPRALIRVWCPGGRGSGRLLRPRGRRVGSGRGRGAGGRGKGARPLGSTRRPGRRQRLRASQHRGGGLRVPVPLVPGLAGAPRPLSSPPYPRLPAGDFLTHRGSRLRRTVPSGRRRASG